MAHRHTFSLVAAIALIASLSLLARGQRSGDTSALQGKPAPDISLKTLDGKDFKLSDQKGKVVVLDFWATWCPPCRKSLPHIQEISQNKDLAAKGLVVFAINATASAQNEKSAAVKFMEDNKYSFTVPMDAAGATMKAYGVQGIPTTVIVGPDGKVRKVFVGFGEDSAKQIDDAINAALADVKPAA